MRTSFIAGNWKMHKTVKEAAELAEAVVSAVADCETGVMLAPPFTALSAVSDVIRGSNVELGAQNMGPDTAGAHTGEISHTMLKDIGVKYVILGHSERRHVYGEGDDLINKKVKLAASSGLDVVLCVGETLDERDRGQAENIVRNQVKKGIDGLDRSELEHFVIAYEPVWAIGTGKTATPDDANAIHGFIRRLFADLVGAEYADGLIIQYGGSVKPENIKDLMAMEHIDGALVGGASLKAETFVPIVRYNEA